MVCLWYVFGKPLWIVEVNIKGDVSIWYTVSFGDILGFSHGQTFS